MESNSAVKRRWVELFRRTGGLTFEQLRAGDSWSAPTARLMHQQVKPRVGRSWFPFSNETVFYYLDMERDAHWANMDLGVDAGNIFSGLGRRS